MESCADRLLAVKQYKNTFKRSHFTGHVRNFISFVTMPIFKMWFSSCKRRFIKQKDNEDSEGKSDETGFWSSDKLDDVVASLLAVSLSAWWMPYDTAYSNPDSPPYFLLCFMLDVITVGVVSAVGSSDSSFLWRYFVRIVGYETREFLLYPYEVGFDLEFVKHPGIFAFLAHTAATAFPLMIGSTFWSSVLQKRGAVQTWGERGNRLIAGLIALSIACWINDLSDQDCDTWQSSVTLLSTLAAFTCLEVFLASSLGQNMFPPNEAADTFWYMMLDSFAGFTKRDNAMQLRHVETLEMGALNALVTRLTDASLRDDQKRKMCDDVQSVLKKQRTDLKLHKTGTPAVTVSDELLKALASNHYDTPE